MPSVLGYLYGSIILDLLLHIDFVINDNETPLPENAVAPWGVLGIASQSPC